MKSCSYYKYLDFDGERFFTAILLPECGGRWPVVIMRSPYVSGAECVAEESLVADCAQRYKSWIERGYAVVFQHCRGQGKSTGAFVPYVHEREDGLNLRQWVRQQEFYNGELFLVGGSYTASLHYATAPFEADVKGAVFEVQDSERYRLWYRNGQMRKGHTNWHFELYKAKCGLDKHFDMASFGQLPIEGLSQRALGERAEDFEQMLEAPRKDHSFWDTRNGGADARNATQDTHVPMLLTTGYNDFYVGGMFAMWGEMTEATRSRCAMLVSPYDHGDGYYAGESVYFPGGKRTEAFGQDYRIDWLDHVRLGTPLPYEKGKITYYRAFENRWDTDFWAVPVKAQVALLGKGQRTLHYDPKDAPGQCGEGGFMPSFDGRADVITIYTLPFEKDAFVKGQMRARVVVSTNVPDCAYHVAISIQKPDGDVKLRHDITSISFSKGDYRPGEKVCLEFAFDPHAFRVEKGEGLRVDISCADDNTYVCHTCQKGPYHLQTKSSPAISTVWLDESCIILPEETDAE